MTNVLHSKKTKQNKTKNKTKKNAPTEITFPIVQMSMA